MTLFELLSIVLTFYVFFRQKILLAKKLIKIIIKNGIFERIENKCVSLGNRRNGFKIRYLHTCDQISINKIINFRG